MALSEERINELKAQAVDAWRKAGFEPMLYVFVASAVEAEVRKEYTELIRQMREALEHAEAWGEELKPAPAWVADAQSALAAANARLEGKP